LTRYIKFIERKYNPACGCSTLRLGSIDQYRAFDAATGTGDPDEAQHGFRFGKGFIIDMGKDYFYDSPLYTTGMMKVDREAMQRHENASVMRGDLSHSPGSIIWPRENFFIYCIAALEDDEEPTWEMAQRIRPGADSAFEIHDVGAFVNEIVQVLAPNLRPKHFNPEVMRRFQAVGGKPWELKPSTGRGKVTYVDDLLALITTEEEFRKFSEQWDSNMFRCAFRKLRKFEDQKEYRIALMFDHPLIGRMPPANTWLDLLFVEMKSIGSEVPLVRSRSRDSGFKVNVAPLLQ
jgi:hypothetical protein